MKTPEEIKKGLGYGVANCNNCISCQDECPYVGVCSPCDDDVNSDVPQEMLADALTYIQQLEAQVPRWISVEERFPEIAEHRGKYDVSVRVLCACLQKSGRRIVKEGYFEIFDGKYFDWRIPGTINKVTHWMPLPEAPKEDAKWKYLI